MKILILTICASILFLNCSGDSVPEHEENENNGEYNLALITTTCSDIFDESVSVTINEDQIFINSHNEDFQDFEGVESDDGTYAIDVSFNDSNEYSCYLEFSGFMGITCETDSFICYVNYFKNHD